MWAQKYIATYWVCMYRKESEKWLRLEEKQRSELLDLTPLEPITGKRKKGNNFMQDKIISLAKKTLNITTVWNVKEIKVFSVRGKKSKSRENFLWVLTQTSNTSITRELLEQNNNNNYLFIIRTAAVIRFKDKLKGISSLFDAAVNHRRAENWAKTTVLVNKNLWHYSQNLWKHLKNNLTIK